MQNRNTNRKIRSICGISVLLILLTPTIPIAGILVGLPLLLFRRHLLSYGLNWKLVKIAACVGILASVFFGLTQATNIHIGVQLCVSFALVVICVYCAYKIKYYHIDTQRRS